MPINPIDAAAYCLYPPGPEEPDGQAASVQRQVRELLAESAPSVEEILNRIREIQDEIGGLRFDMYRPAGRAEEAAATLVARGQLMVRMAEPEGLVSTAPGAEGTAAGARPVSDRQGIIDALRDLNYWPVERSNRDSRTEIFEYDGAREPADMAADIRTLRERKVFANMHVVVPLGYIVKGGDLPAATTYRPERTPGGSYPPGSPRVRVAVIDTGIGPVRCADRWLTDVEREPANSELLDVAPANQRLDWFSGHGSFTAGVVQQVAPDVEIVAYRFTGNNGLGTEKDVADAMILAAEEADADAAAGGEPIRLIINASVGAPAAVDGTPPLSLRDAVELIQERYPEVLIVASAGNDGTGDPMYPGAFKQVVGVGALTDDMQGAPFSNRGFWVDCSAVGVGVVSTFVEGVLPPEERFDNRYDVVSFPDDPFAVWTGTSFTAPQVSGAVAQLCRQNPQLTPRAALNRLLAGQPEIPGFGRILRILPGTPVTP
jgi:subtilisin family serine protease